jgi:light-regulated signal transduction histidine kinase (bacteriophytochrome)
MDKLIEDLLKLSRVGRSEMQRGKVDLSALARNIAAELVKGEPQRHVQINVAPGLEAIGDERLLRVALTNLIRNAWKFTRTQPTPMIEIGRLERPELTFYVKDNGAGFDMAYSAKLFGVFQRLHTAAEFPGTGVGLATVQRIVNRHGGRVWGEGVVNAGATFYFTLPQNVEM